MANEHPKIEHRLENGDVLIIPTTRRDPHVDAVFKDALEQIREGNRARFVEFQRSQRESA